MSQTSFSFPILENDELLPCLSEMEVALDANQLAKPSYEVVRCVFEQIVILLTGVTRYACLGASLSCHEAMGSHCGKAAITIAHKGCSLPHYTISFTCHCCREELTQPVFTAMDAFEYPELHDESIPTNNFFRLLSKLMVASGVKDFGWRVGFYGG